MRKMCRLVFLSYVFLLAIQSPLISAQTCNSTTGTYQTCCPSYDKKALTFQGREYRVYCDAELGPSSSKGATSPYDCAKSCTSNSPLWAFDTPRGRGRCACSSFDPKPGKISFLPMDSELAKDLSKCQTDSKTSTDQANDCQTKLGTCSPALKTCQGQLTTCQGQCNTSCPGELRRCKDELERVDKTCPGRLGTCNTALTKSNQELQKYKRGCPYLLAKCPRGHVKDSTNPCKCKPKPKKPAKKKAPLVDCKQRFKTIDGARYMVRCGNLPYQYLIGENPYSGHRAKNVLECARKCTNTKCLWLWYQPLEKKCFLRYKMWTTADTHWSKGNIDIVLQRWD